MGLIIAVAQASAESCNVFGPEGTSTNENHAVKNYQPTYNSCFFQGREVLSLRSFSLNGQNVNLMVEPNTSKTSIVFQECLKSCGEVDELYFNGSHYGANHLNSFMSPFPLMNDGLGFGGSQKYIALTIDMCPSSRGFSSDVYTKLDELSKNQLRAIPVGVAMTKRWLKRWPTEFKQIKKLQLEGKLEVDWVNHSANHRYNPKKSLDENFLLMAGTDMEEEVLGNEVALIEEGVTPSVYFRFPGLVSDYDTINYVANLGLITLGSNAWLAKGEEPQFGSIILIHGNRNEVVGEKKLIKYIDEMIKLGHMFGSLDQVLN